MAEFKDLTERVLLILKNRINKEVFKQDHIDYLELEKYIQYLKCEPLIIQATKIPTIVSLANAFQRGESIDSRLKELDTYFSMYDKLIEIELIKKKPHRKTDKQPYQFDAEFPQFDFEPPAEYEIISPQEFLKFTEEVRKATIVYIIRLKIGPYIEDQMDVISARGQFAHSKISTIYNQIRAAQDEFTEQVNNNSGSENLEDEENISAPDQVFKFNNEQIQENVFNSLKAYFNDSEHESLQRLLNSENIDSKLLFNGSCKSLCYPFRQLHIHNKLVNQKSTTIKWICDNFNYVQSGTIKQCAKGNVHKNLNKSDLSFPKSNRIMIQGITHLELTDK